MVVLPRFVLGSYKNTLESLMNWVVFYLLADDISYTSIYYTRLPVKYICKNALIR